jgi:transcriptional regulator with XRE-family HTH domain
LTDTGEKVPRPAAVLIGGRVAEVRESLGWSRYRLAKETELSESYLGQLEKGLYVPSVVTLMTISAAFGLCSVEELLTGRPFGTKDVIAALRSESHEVEPQAVKPG